jgi:hypothetical protein
MFLQEAIPDTSRYMVMGYTISFAVFIFYALSLYIRNRNLRRDLAMLEEMEETEAAEETLESPKGKNASASARKKGGK